MRFRSIRRRVALIPALLPLLGGCNILSDNPPDQVHVIVDANPQEPLLLIVSSNFVVGTNSQGQGQSSIARGDSTFISGPYDHTYTLSSAAGQILVHLQNDGANTESVRLRILFDGKSEYDTSKNLATGDFLEYAYTNLSY
jgi:hypothetical protein